MDKTHYFQLCFSEYNGAIPRKRIQKKKQVPSFKIGITNFLSLSLFLRLVGGGARARKKKAPKYDCNSNLGFPFPLWHLN